MYSRMIINVFCFKQKTAYEMRISDWSSDVCSSDLLEGAEAFVKGEADAAGADDAEHRGRAHQGLEAIEREAAPQRQHLRDDAVDHLLQAAGAGGADALDRARVDGLDRLGEARQSRGSGKQG